jgi:hypothetical protein
VEKRISFLFVYSLIAFLLPVMFAQTNQNNPKLVINDKGYYELQSLDVTVFDDFYPEGHQGGLTIVQFGKRVAANGDIRLDPTPGQWSPIPKVGNKYVDKANGTIKVELWYPDSTRDKTGFNPIDYPDLKFKYNVRTEAVGQSIKVIVDLEKPLPDNWADKVGFNLELFPGAYYGEHYLMDGKPGLFARQSSSRIEIDNDKNLVVNPLAVGKELIISPGNEEKEIKFKSFAGDLQLIDECGKFNNGWFVLRSTIHAGAVKNAVEWLITPKINTNWRYAPVIQISQIGYHPKQVKFAVIELDKLTGTFEPIQLIKINAGLDSVIKTKNNPMPWGNFLRYKYLRFDFSDIKEEGLYKIKYGNTESNEFVIKNDVFTNNVWQPTLEYFLPVQMCHMRVEDRYRVWHGICHMDDAIMAPINHNHFDGYLQGESTLTSFKSGEHVPGLNIGGWHDAGDYDLRVESQAETVYKLSLAYEFFKDDFDGTTINQKTRLVELNKPDGVPDILQQMEHGLLSIIGGYESMGRLYKGIQEATLHQYVLLGEAANATDNLIYKPGENDPILGSPLPEDDRLVFTEKNPARELNTAYVLAAAKRVLGKYNPELADKCLKISEELYNSNSSAPIADKINAAAELYLTTSKDEYKKLLIDNVDLICKNTIRYSIVLGRIVEKINDKEFTDKVDMAVAETYKVITEQQKENPYGVPYKPYIWGAGWGIQAFGVNQLFLHIGFPKIFGSEYAFNALNFVLGCHPGENNASFVSGVGVNSMTVAYGFNRADWSYIPGGVASGTALIRPDLPELKVWPYFWQQGEYVLGGGTTDFILLAMAADHLFNEE